MLNLIRMDLYRLVKAKFIRVLLLCAAAVAVFCVAATKVDLNMLEKSAVTETAESTEGGVAYGVTVDTNPEWGKGKFGADELMQSYVQGGILMMFCTVLASIFVSSEQKSGFIKNIAGQLPNRGMLALSKFAALAVGTLMIFVTFTVSTILSGWIAFGSQMTLGSVRVFLPFLGIQYLMHLAFGGLVMLAAILTQSTAFSMTAGMLYSTGITGLLYSGINKLIGWLIPGAKGFNIGTYMLDTNISRTGLEASSSQLGLALICSVIFAVISIWISMVILKKRDIR